MKLFVLVLAVLAVILTGCLGSEDLDRSSRPTPPPSTPVLIPTATLTMAPALSDVEVKQALITLADLPSTWYNADTRAPARSDSERCDLPNPFLANPPIADATETFAASREGPWIAETIFQLESPEHAQALMDDMRLSFSCGSWIQVNEPEPTPTAVAEATAGPTVTPNPSATSTEEPPTEIAWDIATPDELQLRSSAFLTRMISDTALPVEFELVFVRENNLVILISHWAYEGVSNEITIGPTRASATRSRCRSSTVRWKS